MKEKLINGQAYTFELAGGKVTGLAGTYIEEYNGIYTCGQVFTLDRITSVKPFKKETSGE